MTESAFERLHQQPVDSLNLTVSEYRHRGTGARHLHLACEDTNNAFMVAFLTVPQDSSGVAHILEHTTLCGSQRFPVRDPFFMMSRRSLNTFMNAFTSSDWTAYPFASQNRQDFNNLMDVYLDAVFFPRLEELDFRQEGHRVEFEEPENPDSDLVFKGVVFNEMKGAMSSTTQTLWRLMHKHLFPTITYHHNSGGDPEAIPDLSYQALKAFHVRHYHPSNAIFLTYGNLPVEEHQARIQAQGLAGFERVAMDMAVPDEQRYPRPVVAREPYAVEPGESRERAQVVVAWLLDAITDPRALMDAHFLSGVLMDNSASPLRHALETTDLGSSPSELCGLDDSTREMGLMAGLEGSEPERAEAIEALILETLEQVAREGVPAEQAEAVLHQLELHQREITGGGFPYGLRLMVNMLNPTIHGGDPVAALDIDPVLAALREDVRDPEFIKGLVRRKLLDNSHRVRLVLAPDEQLAGRRLQAERDRLAQIKAGLDEAGRQAVVERARALKVRQEQPDDVELLPKVTLADVPDDLVVAEGQSLDGPPIPVHAFEQGTNGMVYQQLVVDLPAMEPALLDQLSLFCSCLTEVGCGERDYLQAQAWQASYTGGVGARISLRGGVTDVAEPRGVFVLYGKALARNQAQLNEILHATFHRARFDEPERLRELVAQMRAYAQDSVTERGHSYAITAASADLSPSARMSERWSGLHGLRGLKSLDDQLDEADALAAFAASLGRIRDRLLTGQRQMLLIGEARNLDTLKQGVTGLWSPARGASVAAPDWPGEAEGPVRDLWTTGTQVNFCAKVYPAVPPAHADAPALTVLGEYLRNGFLHRVVREQGGAYGAGAGYDSDAGAFRFYSYRDPRLEETLEDFDRALEWLREGQHEPRELEEAILGVVSSIDRPNSPSGEAVSAFFGALHGRDADYRRRFRAQVLRVTLDDLRRAAQAWLDPARARVVAVTDPATGQQKAAAGFRVREI